MYPLLEPIGMATFKWKPCSLMDLLHVKECPDIYDDELKVAWNSKSSNDLIKLDVVLKRGYFEIAPPWELQRLFWIGRVDPCSSFYGIPKVKRLYFGNRRSFFLQCTFFVGLGFEFSQSFISVSPSDSSPQRIW